MPFITIVELNFGVVQIYHQTTFCMEYNHKQIFFLQRVSNAFVICDSCLSFGQCGLLVVVAMYM